MKQKHVIITSIFLVLAFQMLAVSQEANKAKAMPQALIEHQLVRKGLITENNIQVTVTGNTVTLTGAVSTIDARKRAEREIKNLDANYNIINNLTVKYSAITDSVLAKAVQDRINGYVFYSIFDWVTVEANNGAVTLRGSGHLPWTARQIQSVVEKIKNVQSIDNQIQFVQGPDDIRFQAARAIYNDPMFENYAYMPVPPIHIVVNGPVITLEGNIYGESLRGWAGVLAEFHTDAIRVVNDIKVINNS
jgi:osmotically-inducible protein OsmY